MHFSYLGDMVGWRKAGREQKVPRKAYNASVRGLVYTHYGRVSTILTLRVYRLSDTIAYSEN